MEIQIPLVLFTSFLAWAAGIFATQCVLALRKEGQDIQVPVLITAAVVLVIGGIAVVFHLTNPFNLFNGFGHISSGITQELIAIVLVAVAMLLFFLMLRRSEDKSVPQWISVVGIVLSVVLIFSMGHSYMLAALPAWDSIFQVLSLVGAACVMGPATVALIAAVKKVDIKDIERMVMIGTAVNAVLSVAFMFAMEIQSSSIQSFQYYFDPTHPTQALASADTVSIFTGESIAALVFTLLAIVVTFVGAFRGKNQGDWKVWGVVMVAAGLVCAVSLRIMMYTMGESLFMLF